MRQAWSWSRSRGAWPSVKQLSSTTMWAERGWETRGDRPDVEVVDVVDVGLGDEVAGDLVEVGGVRRGLEQDDAGLAQESPAAWSMRATTTSEAMASARV